MIQPISFKRQRFPPDVIWYAVWLYFRFTLKPDAEAGEKRRGGKATKAPTAAF